jgi:hypothetical protein
MSRTRVGLVGIIAAGLLLMSVGVARADTLQSADLVLSMTSQPTWQERALLAD